MGVTVEPYITSATDELGKVQVDSEILASSINKIVTLAKKEASHTHSISDTVYGGATSTEDVSSTVVPESLGFVNVGDKISSAVVSQILDIVSALSTHTHTFSDSYSTNCNCNCDCTRGRV
jgi:hypothetical protein